MNQEHGVGNVQSAAKGDDEDGSLLSTPPPLPFSATFIKHLHTLATLPVLKRRCTNKWIPRC